VQGAKIIALRAEFASANMPRDSSTALPEFDASFDAKCSDVAQQISSLREDQQAAGKRIEDMAASQSSSAFTAASSRGAPRSASAGEGT